MGEWICTLVTPPCSPGEISEPLWVQSQEFDQPPSFFVGRCFISTNSSYQQWYMDTDFYAMEHPLFVSGVQYYQKLPSPAPYIPIDLQLSIKNLLKERGNP